MTQHPHQENPDMICAAFHRISVVQPENCYNCVHRHGYPQYLFGDDNCDSFVAKAPTPSPAAPDRLDLLTDAAIEAIKAQARNQTLDDVQYILKQPWFTQGMKESKLKRVREDIESLRTQQHERGDQR